MNCLALEANKHQMVANSGGAIWDRVGAAPRCVDYKKKIIIIISFKNFVIFSSTPLRFCFYMYGPTEFHYFFIIILLVLIYLLAELSHTNPRWNWWQWGELPHTNSALELPFICEERLCLALDLVRGTMS